MAIQYPAALDNFTNPSGTDNLGSSVVPHAAQHSNLNDAVEALEAKVGADASTDPASLDYRVSAIEAGALIPVGWRDLIGDINPKTSGPGTPALNTFIGNIRLFFYSVGDDGDCAFHLPHDYVLGSDIHIHVHWSHNGTAISGSFAVDYSLSYAKGHQQEPFSAQITPQLLVTGLSLVNTPRYMHRVDEIQISAASPGANQFNSNIFEPDGILLVHYDVSQIPSISGGTANEPALITIDLHYQSNGLGTKNKAPDFYV